MQDQPNNSAKSMTGTVVAVAAIVGLAVGFGGAKLMDHSKTSSTTSTASAPAADTKAADLRANLVTLGASHMYLTDQAVDAALDGNADAAQLKTQLITNGTSISAAVGSVYGQSAQDAFQKLWNVHLGDFVNYAVAGKKGDAAAKAAALADIDANYTKPIAMLLSGANPNLPEATVETAFRDHVTMTAAVIDDHNAGKYDQEMTDQQAAVDHIKGLMSTLAGAIVKQYPSKF
jgi:hypothetical protein